MDSVIISFTVPPLLKELLVVYLLPCRLVQGLMMLTRLNSSVRRLMSSRKIFLTVLVLNCSCCCTAPVSPL